MTTLTLERSRELAADPKVVWAIVADLDAYHEFAASITETTVEGEGLGARRWCTDRSGATWVETCAVWEPGRRYVIDVDVATYPLRLRAVFKAFRGTWQIEPVGGGTRVTLRFDATLRRIPGAGLLASKLAERGGDDVEAILEAYEVAATGSG